MSRPEVLATKGVNPVPHYSRHGGNHRGSPGSAQNLQPIKVNKGKSSLEKIM
jgi:hypothetical protein